MKRLVVGILAHVDAGKTTLAESMMYITGNIRKLGRVDHKNTLLDTYELERDRGITIFSKQAILKKGDIEFALLDTPGHVDFSSEMERTLQVLDYAILVISARDGVQGHTETLWKLLEKYQIPTFIFVNKMDMPDTDKKLLLKDIGKRLADSCIDFSVNQDSKDFKENIAMCDDHLFEEYIESGKIKRESIIKAISKRKIFPAYFGSALKLEGIDEFLKGIESFSVLAKYPNDFGARIYKIARDESGNRLTFMKITGGRLKVKMTLGEEKVDQIRIYSASKYEMVDEVKAGTVCAVMGLAKTFPGQGLGIESSYNKPSLEPVLNYQVILPTDCNVHEMLTKLNQLQEEDPQLSIVWNEKLKEIHVKLMGKIQGEIFKSQVLERFGVEVELGAGSIIYKETIAEAVVGIGHFEPLGHYAEVHLLLEPGKAGSGLVFDTDFSEDVLDANWQRLILTHLQEKEHVGVLTGSAITDIKITLLTGRAHQNHTEGGDFRQATYRAVRHGLKKAKSVLLEPYYNFSMEIPTENVGRAMTDIEQMNGKFDPPITDEDMTQLTGYVAVSTFSDYQSELNSYTSGRGRISLTFKGFEPCHNPNEVAAYIGYDSESDLDNPTGSIFCANGAGFFVKWNEVEDYIHVDNEWKKNCDDISLDKEEVKVSSHNSYRGTLEEDKELESIFIRTFGPIKRKLNDSRSLLGYENNNDKSTSQNKTKWKHIKKDQAKENYLLVDAYNIIFAWDELKDLAKDDLSAARMKLIDILSDYQAYKKCKLILVFDAYKVEGGIGQVIEYNNIYVVYTKEAETADMYIEKVTKDIASKHNVVVATSDYLEQIIIIGHGAMRLSANDLKEEIEFAKEEMRTYYKDKTPQRKNRIGDHIDDKLKKFKIE